MSGAKNRYADALVVKKAFLFYMDRHDFLSLMEDFPGTTAANGQNVGILMTEMSGC